MSRITYSLFVLLVMVCPWWVLEVKGNPKWPEQVALHGWLPYFDPSGQALLVDPSGICCILFLEVGAFSFVYVLCQILRD